MRNQDIANHIGTYLEYCQHQKQLSDKTVKAYRIDLNQYVAFAQDHGQPLDRATIQEYIAHLHTAYQPKSAKRKVACLKAFFAHLEYEEILTDNPFKKIKTKFREPFLLPRTIPIEQIQLLLNAVYTAQEQARSPYQRMALLRETSVLELLFATGVRVSELCSLRPENVDLAEGLIKIYGKGAKERMIQIGNSDVLMAVQAYHQAFAGEIQKTGWFFVNRLGHCLSEQSVRDIISKYADACGIALHITPHMFRHSFATLLLEEDVDIRYIQTMLGHSSIVTTQIYTHVAAKKQKDILTTKHPRNRLAVNPG